MYIIFNKIKSKRMRAFAWSFFVSSNARGLQKSALERYSR